MYQDHERPHLKVIQGNRESSSKLEPLPGSRSGKESRSLRIERKVPGEYFKVVYELWNSGQTVDRESVSKVLKALDVDVTTEDLDAIFELYYVVCTACEA